MRRRTISLAIGIVISTSLAGCIQNNGDTGTDDEPNQSSDETSDDSTESNGTSQNFPSITVEVDESNVEYIRGSVEIIRQFSAEAPARLRVSLENDGDESREFAFGSIQPFGGLGGIHVNRDEGLILYPEDDSGFSYEGEIPEESTDGCWRFPDGELLIDDLATTAELQPTKTASMEYDLFDDSDGDECLSEGEYRFEESDFGEQGHEWGFSAILEDE